VILVFHVGALGLLLLQGCKKETEAAKAPVEATPSPTFGADAGASNAVPAGLGWAATNKDRINIGTRKSEEQPPQATETRQFCTEGTTRVRTAAGRDKESMPEAVQTTTCTSAPVSRSTDEARAESRKVERSPDN